MSAVEPTRRAEVVIERAGFADLEALDRLEQASFTAPWSKKALEAELIGNPFSHVWVARDLTSGRILGYICFWIVFDELRIMNLAVAGAERRLGIGTRLVRHALSLGIDQGARRALLEVRCSNRAAQLLYEKLGFRATGSREEYYRNPIEDAVLMERKTVESVVGSRVGSSGRSVDYHPIAAEDEGLRPTR